jgi:hypothetical protein
LKFERRQDKGVPESGLDWEDPTPELLEVSTFREASLTKRGDRFGGGSLDREDISPNAQV